MNLDNNHGDWMVVKRKKWQPPQCNTHADAKHEVVSKNIFKSSKDGSANNVGFHANTYGKTMQNSNIPQ